MAGGGLSLLISLGLGGDLEIIMVAVLSFLIHNLFEVRHKSVSLVIAMHSVLPGAKLFSNPAHSNALCCYSSLSFPKNFFFFCVISSL